MGKPWLRATLATTTNQKAASPPAPKGKPGGGVWRVWSQVRHIRYIQYCDGQRAAP